MTAEFVIDCSITLAWLFPDERTPATDAIRDRLLTETAVVPSHWFLEVANVLTLAEKHGRIAAADVTTFLELLQNLPIVADAGLGFATFEKLVPLCRQYSLTSYDAAYLELAIRRETPIATLDKKLRAAAALAGIAALGE